jgi:hypothetical protein
MPSVAKSPMMANWCMSLGLWKTSRCHGLFIKQQRSAGDDDVFVTQLNCVNWLHQIGTAGNEGLAHGGVSPF